MHIYKRIRLSNEELARLEKDCEGYVWAAIDPHKCVISIGDEYLATLREDLLTRRCRQEDIYCVGFDLRSGEIVFVNHINRRNPSTNARGEVGEDIKNEIRETMAYFFDRLSLEQR